MMAWLPIFFMYFSASLTITHVLLLESIYYISVVLLEIPSGYFSDKIGRRTTLIIATMSFSLSYFIFGFLDPSLFVLIIAQILLACGMSFLSGTDTAFFYESLETENLSHEYLEREADIQTKKQIASAFAVLVGGLLGSLELRYGYIASFIFVFPALIMSWNFKEPLSISDPKHFDFISQLKAVKSEILRPELKWIFIFSINLFILSHIPYEFYQSYLILLEKNDMNLGIHAAIYSGIVFALTRVIGAYASSRSPKWLKQFGLKNLCFIAILFQLLIIGGMAFVLHVGIVLIILLRSFSMSMIAAPINAELAPRLKETHRATYFSFQSLASRLAYSFTLLGLSFLTTESGDEWRSLSNILLYSLVLGIILLAPLLFINSGKLFKPSS